MYVHYQMWSQSCRRSNIDKKFCVTKSNWRAYAVSGYPQPYALLSPFANALWVCPPPPLRFKIERPGGRSSHPPWLFGCPQTPPPPPPLMRGQTLSTAQADLIKRQMTRAYNGVALVKTIRPPPWIKRSKISRLTAIWLLQHV
jgi:hypothetical protein